MRKNKNRFWEILAYGEYTQMDFVKLRSRSVQMRGIWSGLRSVFEEIDDGGDHADALDVGGILVAVLD